MRSKITWLTVCLSTLFLCGCVSKPNYQYYWGSYEDILHRTFSESDEESAAEQIDKFNEDIQKAQAEGKPLPPGFFAHLGMLYAAEGLSDRAVEALIREKELYPESTVLVDRLLENHTEGASNEEQ